MTAQLVYDMCELALHQNTQMHAVYHHESPLKLFSRKQRRVPAMLIERYLHVQICTEYGQNPLKILKHNNLSISRSQASTLRQCISKTASSF